MMKANYDRLRKGLEEALAHVRGEKTGIRVWQRGADAIEGRGQGAGRRSARPDGGLTGKRVPR